MTAFGLAQPKSAGQRGQHLRGGAGRPTLLELYEVVKGNTGQLGYLLAAEPARTPADPGGQADLLGRQPVAPAAQRRAEFAERTRHDVNPTVPSRGAACAFPFARS
jgi:hypothetical protein